uniref:Uncharacterized protein n=1 Tax=Mycobacterium riyadhense TaxID=486698 RepID=A0A653F148_9MYCO|nr:hypothetical protein BIN_B_05107 [Mycobacterium riyadhense]
MVGQASGGVEPFHHHLERHILMLEGRKAARAHLPEQFGKGRSAVDVNPQHQCVDEGTDQLVQGGVTATGHRESHRHIAGRSDHRQQRA